jgi:hypothetical protein
MSAHQHFLVRLLAGFVMFFFGTTQVISSQFSYTFPPNISLEFSKNIVSEKNRLKAEAIIQSRMGTLSDLEIFFDCSKDLKILCNTRTLKHLSQEQIRKVKIIAVTTGEKADELGTWLKMGVRYLPDYKMIREHLNKSPDYSDQHEKAKLKEILDTNELKQARYIEAARLFPASQEKAE